MEDKVGRGYVCSIFKPKHSEFKSDRIFCRVCGWVRPQHPIPRFLSIDQVNEIVDHYVPSRDPAPERGQY